VAASTTILATGAASDVLERFGMCVRTAPSAAAARQYVQVDERTARDHDFLRVAYAAGVCPGYGWLFPGPGGVFNVGVGYAYDAPPRERNIRRLLERFLTSFPPAIELMRAAISVGPLKGAPLRMAMKGARLSRPGLLVVGEAAGLTYSFSGEGIGKALQSGILAANAATSGHGSGDLRRPAFLLVHPPLQGVRPVAAAGRLADHRQRAHLAGELRDLRAATARGAAERSGHWQGAGYSSGNDSSGIHLTARAVSSA
jgi:flavin-dependent dehydrogenase